jgi:hypothetical protein
MCDDSVFGVGSSLEVSYLELISACASVVVGWLVELLVRISGRRGVQGPCWRGGAEGSWESAFLG